MVRADAQVLAFTMSRVRPDEPDIHVMLNMSDARCSMDFPACEGLTRSRAIDTWEQSPAGHNRTSGPGPGKHRVLSGEAALDGSAGEQTRGA